MRLAMERRRGTLQHSYGGSASLPLVRVRTRCFRNPVDLDRGGASRDQLLAAPHTRELTAGVGYSGISGGRGTDRVGLRDIGCILEMKPHQHHNRRIMRT